MTAAIEETNRRREIQAQYNLDNHITPLSIDKPIRLQLVKRDKAAKESNTNVSDLILQTKAERTNFTPEDRLNRLKYLEKEMRKAAKNWDFESAAALRDLISSLKD